jgi:hypothetical protein
VVEVRPLLLERGTVFVLGGRRRVRDGCPQFRLRRLVRFVDVW